MDAASVIWVPKRIREGRALELPLRALRLRESFACRPPGGGGAGTDVTLVNDALTTNTTDPSPASCSITFNSDGSITVAADSSGSNSRWWTNSLGGSVRWIKVNPTTGTFSSGTTGTVLALTSNRTWSVSRSSPPGTKECVATYEIYSDAGGTSLVQSVSITLTATVNP